MKLSRDSELWSRFKLSLKSESVPIDSGFLFLVWFLGSLICRRIWDLRTLPPHDFWIIILNCEIVSCVKTQKATLKCDKKDLGPDDDDGFVSSAKQVSCQLVQENFSVTRWKERSSKENCYNELSTIPAGLSGLQASLSARPYHSTVVYRLGGGGWEFWIV